VQNKKQKKAKALGVVVVEENDGSELWLQWCSTTECI